MPPRVFITQPIARSAIERLRDVADVAWNPDAEHILTKDELRAAVREHDILFCLLQDRVDGDVIAANANLRAVASMKITPSDIDVAAATARRIPVTVIPPIVTEATADLHFGLMLDAGAPGSSKAIACCAQAYSRARNRCASRGRSSGARRLDSSAAADASAARWRGEHAGSRCRVLYCGPRRLAENEERDLGLAYVSLNELLAESDFVSIHAPLNPATHHLLGARELALMKPTAFLATRRAARSSTSRRLRFALADRRIAGAGLDVYEHEPRVEPSLPTMANVVLTPHVGSAVAELRETMAHVVVDNIVAVLAGRAPPNCCNPEIYAAPV